MGLKCRCCNKEAIGYWSQAIRDIEYNKSKFIKVEAGEGQTAHVCSRYEDKHGWIVDVYLHENEELE